MTQSAIKVGENRYRASYGRYLEEFAVGDIYEHRPGRTITDADNIHFSLLTMNYHPMHCDAHFASQSEFGKLLVNSGLTVAIVLGMTVNDVSGKSPANLGWTDIKLTHPVFAGDTLYAESEVLNVRESASRPTQGIVTTRTRAFNQHGKQIMEFTRNSLVYKRGYAPGDVPPVGDSKAA